MATAVAGMGLALAGCRGDGSGSMSSGAESGTGIDSLGTESADGTATEGETVGGQAAVLYLLVEPAETVLEVDLGAMASIPYSVTAVYADGTMGDVTAEASWSISEPAIGSMNGATFESSVFADSTFGSAVLTAEVGGEEGQAQVTVAAYRLDADFFFILPFEDGAGEQAKPLTFSTDIKSLDVFVNMDTTASMEGAIENLQQTMATIVEDVQALVPDTQFGVGGFEDFPISPHGQINVDQPFTLYQAITEDMDAVQDALLGYELGDGNDDPESNFEALYQIATGEGLMGPGSTMVPENHDGIGGVGFRQGSLPIVVSITNEISHDPIDNSCGRIYTPAVAAVAHSREQAVEALDGICARVVQLALGGGFCSPFTDGRALAEATGAVIPPEAWDIGGRPGNCASDQCCTGSNNGGMAPNSDGMCPMAYIVQDTGAGVGSSFGAAILLLAAYGQFGVTSLVTGFEVDTMGEALPPGTSTADFIKAVMPLDHGAVPLPGAPDPTLGPTAFENVIPDTDVIFEIRAFNDFIEQTDQPRVFEANIEVLADDCGELDERAVFVLVPPKTLPPPA